MSNEGQTLCITLSTAMSIQRGSQQQETVRLKECHCLEAETARTQRRSCGLFYMDKRIILCKDLRRTTTVYREPTVRGHWTPLHLPSLPSQHSNCQWVKKARTNSGNSHWSFHAAPRMIFHWTWVTFTYKSSITPPATYLISGIPLLHLEKQKLQKHLRKTEPPPLENLKILLELD